tara:strand:+ start:72 stop:965 length:894 start_codon:yes stop_codon:yes gene_type:complete
MSYVKRNWHEYNKNLVNRGNIFLWIDQKVLNQWIVKKKKRGRPAFSSSVIQAGLFLKTFYRCPYRALQGFIQSLIRLMDSKLRAPHYSVFCKRAASSAALLPKLSRRRPSHLIIDSSGLKIRGEGEWKDKVHRCKTRKSWIKLHLGIDAQTQEITAYVISDEKTADSSAVFPILEQSSKRVKHLYGDGAYDRKKVRDICHHKGIDPCIPPRRKGKIHPEKFMKSRNDAILAIRGLGNNEEAFKLWKKLAGYHQRSLVETAFSRLKGLFGNRLNSSKWLNQKAEILFRLHALNRMIRL